LVPPLICELLEGDGLGIDELLIDIDVDPLEHGMLRFIKEAVENGGIGYAVCEPA